MDLVYHPLETAFLRRAAAVGAHPIDGLQITLDAYYIKIKDRILTTSTVFGTVGSDITSPGVLAAIANKLPGPGTIYMKQSLEFKAPVRAGDTVKATVSVRSSGSRKSL